MAPNFNDPSREDLSIISENSQENIFALKIFLQNIDFMIIQQEILIMEYISMKSLKENNCNCHFDTIKVLDGFSNFLILKHIPHISFYEFYKTASLKAIKKYIKSLLENICYLESIGVVHRDIKPNNFLFDPITGKGTLVDYGLATCELKEQDKAEFSELANTLVKLNKFNKSRVGTKGFISPEQYFNTEIINTKSDIWAVGIIMFYFFSHKILNMPIFEEFKEFNTDGFFEEFLPLLLINSKEEIDNYFISMKAKVYIPKILEEKIGTIKIENWFVRRDIDEDGIDLIKGLLALDYKKRFSSKEALNHKWFN